VSLTLLPALFVLLAPRLGRTVPVAPEQGRWYRLAHRVLRRPGLVAGVTAVAMILVALPALRVQWTGVDGSVLPRSKSARVVEQAVAREFPAVGETPTIIALSAPADAAAEVGRYAAAVRAVADVSSVTAPVYLGGSTWQLEARTGGWELGPAAQRAIARIRALPSTVPASVGGRGAEFADQRSALGARLPLALAILVLGTLLALWLMTGSVTLPLKALAMNVLTVGAATGLLVRIFQDGHLQGLLGYTTEHGLEQSDFMVLAAIAFGLSTDYGVFMLSRIKEAHDEGAADDEAVAIGLQRTGGIVTAAAILLAVAIGAFATSQIIFLKEIGVGAVAAVLLDAFVVRTLLVPALMGLLGPWNWWAPRSLRRLHERFGVEESGGLEPRLAPAAR
jgi:RND superfamily putative drug exporter